MNRKHLAIKAIWRILLCYLQLWERARDGYDRKHSGLLISAKQWSEGHSHMNFSVHVHVPKGGKPLHFDPVTFTQSPWLVFTLWVVSWSVTQAGAACWRETFGNTAHMLCKCHRRKSFNSFSTSENINTMMSGCCVENFSCETFLLC